MNRGRAQLLRRPRLTILLLACSAAASALAVGGARSGERAGPTAWVLEATGGEGRPGAASALLERAGFSVAPLPLDRSPAALRGLIFFGSGLAGRAAYDGYLRAHAGALREFIERGNVLVQMPQAAALEPSPPFLPATHLASRDRTRPGPRRLHVLEPGSPLLRGVASDQGQLAWTAAPPVVDGFAAQGGFQVVVAADSAAVRPLLMDATLGQGRLILSSLPLDRPAAAPAPLAARFAENLRALAGAVRRGQTTAPRLTPSTVSRPFTAGSWTLAVLPDTQVYSVVYPGMFTAQTGWIAAHALRFDIRFVIHLGDVVDGNTEPEWRRAAAAMSLLDGRVPYALVPGNHDYGVAGDASTRETLLNQHFPFAEAARQPTFGGAFERGRLDNTFHLLSAGGRQFIILALEWGPREAVIAWANQVLGRFPDRLAILVTHSYLNDDGRRDDFADRQHPQRFNPHHYRTPGGLNDGEELWQKLVRRHRFVLVLSGHALGDGTGYLASRTDAGTTCHQVLANYQMRHMGGGGYLRLLEFLPGDGGTVRVHTYSPFYDRYLWDPDHAFTFTLGDASETEGLQASR